MEANWMVEAMSTAGFDIVGGVVEDGLGCELSRVELGNYALA